MGRGKEYKFRFFGLTSLSIFWEGSWPCSWRLSEIRMRGNLCPTVNYGTWLPVSGNKERTLLKPHTSMLHKERRGRQECGVERAWAGTCMIVRSGRAWMRTFTEEPNGRMEAGGYMEGRWHARKLEYTETKAGNSHTWKNMCTLISVSIYYVLGLHWSIKQKKSHVIFIPQQSSREIQIICGILSRATARNGTEGCWALEMCLVWIECHKHKPRPDFKDLVKKLM